MDLLFSSYVVSQEVRWVSDHSLTPAHGNGYGPIYCKPKTTPMGRIWGKDSGHTHHNQKPLPWGRQCGNGYGQTPRSHKTSALTIKEVVGSDLLKQKSSPRGWHWVPTHHNQNLVYEWVEGLGAEALSITLTIIKTSKRGVLQTF